MQSISFQRWMYLILCVVAMIWLGHKDYSGWPSASCRDIRRAEPRPGLSQDPQACGKQASLRDRDYNGGK